MYFHFFIPMKTGIHFPIFFQILNLLKNTLKHLTQQSEINFEKENNKMRNYL